MAAESEKPAWPLMVLAVTSFVPCLGFALASATVSWALLVPRRNARVAVGIAVIGAVLNAGFGFVMATSWLAKHPLSAPTSTSDSLSGLFGATQGHLDRTAALVEEYRAAHGAYPDSLGQMLVPMGAVADSGHIAADTSWAFPLLDPLSVVARNPRLFTYVVSADRQQYDLYSPGRDGKSPSSDDMRPMLSIEERHKSGYQPGL